MIEHLEASGMGSWERLSGAHHGPVKSSGQSFCCTLPIFSPLETVCFQW
ncbi:hypothetical protein [Candidatus Magnetaquicoccus inordinatus]|nr:hypothetical protein [Candidatus Magnetaquicoccus inordinatus]